MEGWWIAFITICLVFIILKKWCHKCYNEERRKTSTTMIESMSQPGAPSESQRPKDDSIFTDPPNSSREHDWGIIAAKGFILSLIISGARNNTKDAMISGLYGALASVVVVGIFE
jgi:hypothetical protein